MKILQASIFDGFVESGGSTRPWLVRLADGRDEIPYIVKLFTDKQISQQHPVFKEAVGCILAKEFGLSVPDFALAEFTSDFIDYSLTDAAREALDRKSQSLKFASKLLDDSIIYSSTLHRSFMKYYDFGNLYAFDTLMYNFDRGRTPSKPNILIKSDSFVVIDHELSLPFIDNESAFFDRVMDGLACGTSGYPFQQHLSYSYLKSLRQKDKAQLFDEFQDNLAHLRIDDVKSAVDTLLSLDVSCGYFDRLFRYLYALKTNSGAFRDILLRSIL